jgi:hypothetical protein
VRKHPSAPIRVNGIPEALEYCLVDSGGPVMFTLLLCPGPEVGGGVANLINEYYVESGLSNYYPPVGPGEVAEWFSYRGHEPEEAAVLVTSGGWVAGVGWVWPDRKGTCNIWILASPGLAGYRLEALNTLLAWAKWVSVSWEECSGVAYLRLGANMAPLHSLATRLLGTLIVEETGCLMKAPHSITYEVPEWVDLVECKLPGDEPLVRAIVEVYNEAFRDYPDFYEWGLDDALRYYRRLVADRSRRVLVIMAYAGSEPAGVAEAHLYKSISGYTIGYVARICHNQQHPPRPVSHQPPIIPQGVI